MTTRAGDGRRTDCTTGSRRRIDTLFALLIIYNTSLLFTQLTLFIVKTFHSSVLIPTIKDNMYYGGVGVKRVASLSIVDGALILSSKVKLTKDSVRR